MWHEARKQEKKIRGMLVDYRKRAERRQDFYERIKADPTQFLQVHGRKCKIHLDANIAAAAENPAIMMPWQAQKDNLIDRFDVRAHLDYIPPVVRTEPTVTEEDDQDERSMNYERYRVLAQNEFLGIIEEKFLHQLFLEEQFGVNAQLEAEGKASSSKKKSSAGAAIGYTYEETELVTSSGGTGGPGANVPFAQTITAIESGASSKYDECMKDESDSDLDMDVSIDINKVGTTQAHEMNACGRHYGMKSNDFYSYLTKDADEADALRLAREEEQEKIMFSGRKSRRERRAQRERKFAGRPLSPPSYAAKEELVPRTFVETNDSSRSPSPVNSGKITYITSFGGEDELQPHAKISINFSKDAQGRGMAGGSRGGRGGAKAGLSYTEKVKQNLEKLKAMETKESDRRPVQYQLRAGRGRKSRSRSSSRSRSRSRGRSSSSDSRSRSRSRSHSRSAASSRGRSWKNRPRSRSRSRSRGRKYPSRYRRRSASRSKSRSRSRSPSRDRRSPRRRSPGYSFRRKGTRSSSSTSSPSSSPPPVAYSAGLARRTASKRVTPKPKSDSSGSRSPLPKHSQRAKSTATIPLLPLVASIPRPPPPTTVAAVRREEPVAAIVPTIIEPEPEIPIKRYYGRKRGDESSSNELSSSDESREPEKQIPDEELAMATADLAPSSNFPALPDVTVPPPVVTGGTAVPIKQEKPDQGCYGTAGSSLRFGKTVTGSTSASESKAGCSTGSAGAPKPGVNPRDRLKRKMQILLNKQYKADKKAETEKVERLMQQQQERDDEMRELALKLRRRQRELRHKYGTPESDRTTKSSSVDSSGSEPRPTKEQRLPTVKEESPAPVQPASRTPQASVAVATRGGGEGSSGGVSHLTSAVIERKPVLRRQTHMQRSRSPVPVSGSRTRSRRSRSKSDSRSRTPLSAAASTTGGSGNPRMISSRGSRYEDRNRRRSPARYRSRSKSREGRRFGPPDDGGGRRGGRDCGRPRDYERGDGGGSRGRYRHRSGSRGRQSPPSRGRRSRSRSRGNGGTSGSSRRDRGSPKAVKKLVDY